MTLLYYFFLPLNFSHAFFQNMCTLLPKCEHKRILRFRNVRDAYVSLSGKLLLRKAMQNLGVSEQLDALKFTKFGKPYFPDPRFCFSISHSAGCVACVASNEVKMIGLDVEKMVPVDFYQFKFLWNESEWVDICSSDSIKVFYEYWTAKEAILKADGRGLLIEPRQVCVVETRGVLGARVFSLRKILINNTFLATIAASMELENLLLREFALSDTVPIELVAKTPVGRDRVL